MWFPDLSGLAVNEDAAFVLHVWAELFGEDTPISHTPRLQDTLSLVEELKDVARRAEKEDRWRRNVESILAELKESSERDNVLEEKYPLAKFTVNEIKKDDNVSQIRRAADVLSDQLKDYEKNVFAHLEKTLEILPPVKEKVVEALKKTATRAVQKGFAREELRSILDEKMFEQTSKDVGKTILASLKQKKRTWTCILTIKGNPADTEALVNSVGYRRMSNKEKPLGDSGKKLGENLKLLDRESTFQVIASTEAVKSTEAVRQILEPLRLIVDIANFTHRSGRFKIYPFVYLKTANFEDVIDIDAGSYAGIEPQTDAVNLTVEYQKSGLLARLPKRIITSLEQHSIAHSSTDAKQRFVNLWVALETLVGHESGISIIDNIVNQINPLIIHRRVNNIIKYLAISLHKFGFCRVYKDPTGWFKKSSRSGIWRDELLLAMTNGAAPNVADELVKIIDGHPLLRNRIFTVYKELSDFKALRVGLQSSEKRSKWQLQRIYRTRNILVHSGREISHLAQLTTHLEYYYSLTLSRILHDFKNHKKWTIEKSFESRRQMYQYLEHCLKNDKEKITVNDILQRGDSYLGKRRLWK